MARTGIKITTTDTVLGKPLDVNTTSMILTQDIDTELGSNFVIKGRSLAEFIDKGLRDESVTAKCIGKYFSPSPTVSLDGNLLWVAGYDGTTDGILAAVRATVVNSFDERPRQIMVIADERTDEGFGGVDASSISTFTDAASQLAKEGIRVVFLIATALDGGEDETTSNSITNADDVTKWNSPFSAICPMKSSADSTIIDGVVYAGATLATISVGTSIGDGGLEAITTPSILAIYRDDESDASVDVKSLALSNVEALGEKGYLFTRTRPPRNGLWWNDGATCNTSANALSSLEAARTICSMADDLQAFFVPYINTRVPVTSTGDIQSTYKQVVLDNARAAVVQKYIESGDISDARINLVAKDNDMIGTRTWEVTLSILPAPTLRWVDGYVFYVKNL